MTDSILRSYQHLSYTTVIPFPFVADIDFASDLLSGESEGFAIDATTYDEATAAVYVGGPVGGTVAVIDTGTPANDLSDVALDSSNLVQSGTSPKMVHFPDSPYVRWTPHNYCPESQTLGTTWIPNQVTVSSNSTTAPDGTSTADTIACNTGTAGSIKMTPQSTLASTVYTVSCYFKQLVTDWVFLELSDISTGGAGSWFNLATGATGGDGAGGGVTVVDSYTVDAGSGWYRCVVVVNSGTSAAATGLRVQIKLSDGDFDDVIAVGDSIYLWGAQVNRGPIPLPYLVTTSTVPRVGIPQSYDPVEEQYGILVEPAATNLFLRSEEFDNASWTKIGTSATVDDNATTAPDGSSNADAFIPGAATAAFALRQSPAVSSGVTYTFSCYLKIGALGPNHVQFAVVAGGVFRFWANISTGVAGSTSGSPTSTSLISIGNGWYRMAMTFPSTDTTAQCYIQPDNADGVDGTETGDGVTPVFYVWGAQLEAGGVASSYVPTIGSTSTRAVDDVTLALSTTPHSATENTVYISCKPRAIASTAFSTEGGAAFVNILHSNATGDIKMFVFDTVTLWVDLDSTQNASANVTYQDTGVFKANDFALSVNGAAVQTDTAGTLPTVTNLKVGRDFNANSLNGHVYRVVYVPRRVSDGDLPSWRYTA